MVLAAILGMTVTVPAQNAVNVTIEADATDLMVGEATTVRVYGQINGTIAPVSEQITSWYVDVLNDNGAVLGAYTNVFTPASDNTPATSFDGTPDGAHLRGIHDWFLATPAAGKGSRVELVRFDVTALAAGTSTLTVAPGTTLTGVVHDFQVAQLGFGGTFTGGNFSAASVAITVTGELDLSGLGLAIEVVGTQAEVTFNPVPGYDHVVEWSATLLPLSWTPVPGGPHNTGVVTQVVTGFPKRFYRVVLTPQ
jgi:hypothetical protein